MEIKIDEFKKILILHIAGNLTESHLDEIESLWNYAVLKCPGRIGIDCCNLNTIDVSAIGTLVLFLNHAMNRRIELIFYDISSELKSLFSITHIDDFCTIKTKKYIKNNYISFSEVA